MKELRDQIDDLQYENDQLRENSRHDIEDLTDRYESEKDHMRKTFEQSLDELRKQCTQHREDVKRLSEQLNAEELSNIDMKNAMNKLNKEKCKLNRELSLVKEQMEREKTLLETECRARLVSAQSNYERKLDEERSKNEEDKRSIYSFIANEFHEFYKPTDRINESTFKNVVRDVRESILSLLHSDSTIRSILGAVDGQTTEDAVAQILLNQ